MSLLKLKEPKKGREKPKLTLVEVTKKDMSIKKVTKSMTSKMTSDKIEWKKIMCGQPRLSIENS